jgi:sterol 24-C-methyltransferase
MTSTALEREDTVRDTAFNEILHGKSANARGGLTAMRGKDSAAHKAAMDAYFKHWDDKDYETETADIREVGYFMT